MPNCKIAPSAAAGNGCHATIGPIATRRCRTNIALPKRAVVHHAIQKARSTEKSSSRGAWMLEKWRSEGKRHPKPQGRSCAFVSAECRSRSLMAGVGRSAQLKQNNTKPKHKREWHITLARMLHKGRPHDASLRCMAKQRPRAARAMSSRSSAVPHKYIAACTGCVVATTQIVPAPAVLANKATMIAWHSVDGRKLLLLLGPDLVAQRGPVIDCRRNELLRVTSHTELSVACKRMPGRRIQ